ncbi:MAG: DinB family protein, partial [Deltaproteobacteria bacterium]|nr:DinB family protein [Deltaproteobacteria bacterium]
RTLHFIDAIPADRIDWSPSDGEFSFGDIIRHLAATEYMFIGAVVKGKWKYAGHKIEENQERDVAIALLKSTHQEAMKILGTLSDSDLNEGRPSLSGQEVKTWRLLMAMIEHEVHHRSQIAMYLTLIKIKPPHIYGLGVEDVIALATG